MRKHMHFIVPLVGLVLITVLAAGSGTNVYRRFGDIFLAAIGIQNTTSSQNPAVSSSTDISTATSTLTIADVLQQLQAEFQILNGQVVDLRSEIEINNLRSIFTRTLKRGDVGNDVSKLQELLTRFPELYPPDPDASSTVTGFYGSLTKAAVMQLQSQAGLKKTGIFDSGTKETFYESIKALAEDNAPAEFTPIDISSIADLNNVDGPERQSITDLQDQISQLVSDSLNAQGSIANLQDQISGLASDLAIAHEEIVSLENQPSASPTFIMPAAPPPLAISDIQATNITQRSSTVVWATNVLSTSEVDYSTDANLPTNKTSVTSSTVMVTNHAVVLQNLNNGTKYYYRVLSKDNTNTPASSTVQNFTTLH